MTGERAGVLVIRMWIEDDHDAPFRARILAVETPHEVVQQVAVASSANEVVDVVRDWLSWAEPARGQE